eukprot:Gb_05438 [translate_table: standard]
MTSTAALQTEGNVNNGSPEDVRTLCKQGRLKEALHMLHAMNQLVDTSTYVSLLQVCINKRSLSEGKIVHIHMNESGFMPHNFLGNTLVNMYTKCESLVDARRVFDEMLKRDAFSWNIMIGAYLRQGFPEEVLALFHQMQRTGIQPKSVHLCQCSPRYKQSGRVDEALKLFQQMPEQDAVSWTAMIAGYVQNGQALEALKLFGQMRLAGVKPDQNTFASVLPAFANLVALEEGMEIDEEIVRRGVQSDVYVEGALLDMYAKCGCIKMARDLFDKMHQRDAFSWTVMIAAYAMHGCGEEALKLFEQMQHSGMKPNDVTFVCVLSACRNAGLVDKGWKYFCCMSQYYHITPTMERYVCMVDLLGHAGHLVEAQDFINKMLIKPDVTVWSCLLGVCRMHSNVDLGERVAEKLFELNPKNAAPYVLVSNIYATVGSSHPQMPKIYAKLERLSTQMEEAGYVPDTRFVLHDVKEEQKKQILYHHSEKLAIAFGLISKSPGKTIWVIKNLRVCRLPLCHQGHLQDCSTRNCCEGCQPLPSFQMGSVLVEIIGDAK